MLKVSALSEGQLLLLDLKGLRGNIQLIQLRVQQGMDMKI
jgi:hypothetical protein